MAELFTPFKIKQVEFRNRVVMPPMVKRHGDEDGHVTDQVLEYYGERAAAGTAMIIVEATAVDPDGRCWEGGLCAYDDGYSAGLARLAERIKQEGAVACIQLVHGGPQANPDITGKDPVGPSAVRPSKDAPMPRALTVEEILQIEQRFENAAARCIDAGFDAVEVHGAHGFLLDSFLSKRRNVRGDDYGGLLQDRVRMLAEVCTRTRKRIGREPVLQCRVSIWNHMDEGFSPLDLQQLISRLESTGIDLLHVSTQGALEDCFGSDRTIGQWVGALTDLPLIVAGGLGDPADAERLIAKYHAQFAAVGSAMLDDPQWTRHAREALS